MIQSVKHQETELRKKVLQLVSVEFLESLKVPNPLKTVVTFCHIWTVLLISLFAVLFFYQKYGPFSVLPLLPLTLIIASRQNALAVQTHEGSHYHLFPSKFLNDFFCNICCSYWILNDVNSYRKTHLNHHKHLHTDKDPDIGLYSIKGNQKNLKGLIGLILQDICGFTAVKRILVYVKNAHNQKKNFINNHTLGKIIAQFSIFLFFYIFFNFSHSLFLWLIFWIIPLFCVFPVIIRIRIVAEHFNEHGTNTVCFTSRTSSSNLFSDYFLGACMEYHFEHHILPYIPHHNLKKLHRELTDKGFFGCKNINSTKPTHFVSGGYINYWKKLLDKSFR